MSPAPQHRFEWTGRDRSGQVVRGELRSTSRAAARVSLRRQGIAVARLVKAPPPREKAITAKEIATFTRQLATMMQAGVPILQAFEIVAQSGANARFTRLLLDIRSDVQTGTPLSAAFRRYPRYFHELYCNLVAAGEAGGILDTLLRRLAEYEEKTLALRNKVKSALMYPAGVLGVAVLVLAVIMIFVIPAFKDVFASFGAELPAITLMVMGISAFMVEWWWLLLGGAVAAVVLMGQGLRRSARLRDALDAVLLRLPVLGGLMVKAIIARWARTLATLFAAGVPLVDALSSVAGAAGNAVFRDATEAIRRDVSAGMALNKAMQATGRFPPMVLQMTAIGEESGALDQMLEKSAEFFEEEVDEMVKGLSSLLEPFIIVVLGVMIGGIVVAMYLPIFKLGSVV
jgi:type IV pilus assembly protein PilC